MICEKAKYKYWLKKNKLEEENLKRLKDIDMDLGEFKFFNKGVCPGCGGENIIKTQKKIKDEEFKMGKYRRTLKCIGKIKNTMKNKYEYEPFIVFFQCKDCNRKSGYKEV